VSLRPSVLFVLLGVLPIASTEAAAQTVTERGFADAALYVFPQDAPNDPVNVVGDALVREEVFVKPAAWIQFAAGLDVRANTHDQVEDEWRIDFTDRGVKRPRLSIRRASATLTRGPLTVDIGKQFIRWGKTDIVTPTDRFAPRDFLNVVDSEFLGVTGVRVAVQAASNTFDVAWVPFFTPSRVPLLNQRWTAVPEAAADIPLVDDTAQLPERSQVGVRWSHVATAFEYALSFFDGLNNLPNIDAAVQTVPPAVLVTRIYPRIRTYGADVAVPTRWFTLKGEAAYFTSSSPRTDEYVLYVAQIERQSGEWVIVGGYAGEAVTARRATLTFAPDRGMTRSIVGRASYTIDPIRSVAFETAVRQTGDGFYAKAEYSQARGQHWRATVMSVVIGGQPDDFLGQYSHNSHVEATLRYSF